MYKNKIKNKLQKLYNRTPEIPNPVLPAHSPRKNEPALLKSTRRSKLSLSKDLSVASNTSAGQEHPQKEQSFSQSRKAYIRLVSNSAQKDLSCLSNSKICLTNHGGNSERIQKQDQKNVSKFTFFENQPKNTNHNRKCSNFDAGELRNMAEHIAKSAAILNEKIVPVLLQAATLSSKASKSQNIEDNLASMFLRSTTELQQEQQSSHVHRDFLQTPINHFKNLSFEEQETWLHERKGMLRCETEPSGPHAQRLKSCHKIEHSPAPVHSRKHSHSNRDSQQDPKPITALNSFMKDVEKINCERRAVESRISRKLDELSSKASSMAKQYAPDLDEHPRKHKILTSSAKVNLGAKASLEGQGKMTIGATHQQPKGKTEIDSQNRSEIGHPSSRNKNTRNLILNRIFT